MNFGSRIYDMLDELDKAEQGREEYSKYSIIEKYFKKIREDTKDECIEVVKTIGHTKDGGLFRTTTEAAEEIKKL